MIISFHYCHLTWKFVGQIKKKLSMFTYKLKVPSR
ncbi:hypothetical protein SLEP1_g16601 [Rubroshorea leprosula]|uniref:Uncharacterized protein n=1 Tax=Rubroshorea leprosula TaxID=152421 RepID=A0AAV5J209_9ROSI|nr:hypothetical protein SLEP1_g16601 [Rubroshorea leprosula]